jgi:hypothetical protein
VCPDQPSNRMSTWTSMISSGSKYTRGLRENSDDSFNDQPFLCTAQLSLARNY